MTIKVAGQVLLPDDQHKLYCWKVRNGSAVQRGETIALAILKQNNDPTTTTTSSSSSSLSSSSSTTTEASDAAAAVKNPSATSSSGSSSSSSSAHRRPTKRRRPGAIAATDTDAAAAATAASDETDPAAAVSTDDDKMKKQQQQQLQLPPKVVPILATADGLCRMGTASLLNAKRNNYNKKNPLMIGYIETCSHSTVVESLCAVCGACVTVGANKTRVLLGGDDDDDDDDDDDEESRKMSRVTVSGGITVSVSAAESQRMALLDAERLQRQRKLSLVLDLDHTLLHATNDVRARQEALSRDDVRTLILPIMEEQQQQQQHHNQQQPQQQIMWTQHFVKLRPGVKEFLETAMTMYEIGVYTAGTRQYAEQITIILARHLVGAKRDQTDLDQLRHEVARVMAKMGIKNNNNNNDDDACKKPAAKAVTAPAASSKDDSTKTDGALTNGNNSTTTTIGKDETAAGGEPNLYTFQFQNFRSFWTTEETTKEVPNEADGNNATANTAVNCNGVMPASQMPVGDNKSSSADNEAVVSSTVTKDHEADTDNLNKTVNGDSKPVDVTAAAAAAAAAAAVLLDEDAEKKDNSEIPSSSVDDAGIKSALKEDDGDKKMAANGTGKKRKRVIFGDTPPTVKSDQMPTTSEELERLRAELHEAERMEALAHDLRQRLFGSRVVSRTDVKDLGTDVKSLKRIFPCGGTMAVVVDDREDVWANAGDTDMVPKGEPPHNLLVVRPYHWNHFLGYADVNNASGEDLAAELDNGSKINKQYDNDQDEKQLLWTGDILKRIHQRYYGEETTASTTTATTNTPVKSRLTIPELVRNMRREVLMGTKIILSGLVPLHRQQQEGGGRTRLRPAFVRYAENLGAVILPRVGPGLTHVVGAKDGTEKIINARKIPGCWIVKATWLMEAAWSLKRPDSLLHALGPPPKIQPQSDSSDDDDDDLAAELENELIGE